MGRTVERSVIKENVFDFFYTDDRHSSPTAIRFEDIKTVTPLSITMLSNYNSLVLDLVRRRLVINGGRALALKGDKHSSSIICRRRCRQYVGDTGLIESYIFGVMTSDHIEVLIEFFSTGQWRFLQSL